ncbi:hypothetical protein [endosymbiont 'TC1' of Trimyema compressum]|nr:hypothetical protein [endosymbiont 'TC1' of Trimyema compressum]
MMNKLYPETLNRKKLETEIKYFYSNFFHYEMSDEQIKSMIDGKH